MVRGEGSKRNADGYWRTMLVTQAAHAFLLWHGVLPDVEPVIKQLQEILPRESGHPVPDREEWDENKNVYVLPS